MLYKMKMTKENKIIFSLQLKFPFSTLRDNGIGFVPPSVCAIKIVPPVLV